MGVAHTIPNTSIEACLRIRNTRGTFHPEYARHAAAHSLIPSRFSPYVVHAKYSHPPTNAANRFLDGLTSIRSTFHRDHSARRVPRMFRPPPPPFIFNLDSLQRCLVTRDHCNIFLYFFLYLLSSFSLLVFFLNSHDIQRIDFINIWIGIHERGPSNRANTKSLQISSTAITPPKILPEKKKDTQNQ